MGVKSAKPLNQNDEQGRTKALKRRTHMENKEVEDALFYLSVKARRDPYTDPNLVVSYHEGVISYIELLEQQIKTKDKALDKACEEIETTYGEYELPATCPVTKHDFTPSCCGEDFCDGGNKECWKEWCENGKE